MALGTTQPLDRNEYQESSWGVKGGRPARKADNLTTIYEPIVKEMWEPRRRTTLWASTACYRDSFKFLLSTKLISPKNCHCEENAGDTILNAATGISLAFTIATVV
jgi:hypothetical protein